MNSKEYNQRYYQEHKKQAQEYFQEHKVEIRAQQKLYYESHKERWQEHHLRNREKINCRSREYYQNHKQAVNEKTRERRRLHEIRYHSHKKDIKGLNKAPYPPNGDCLICGRASKLGYHHWLDSNPNIGIWVCAGCHRKIHSKSSQPETALS